MVTQGSLQHFILYQKLQIEAKIEECLSNVQEMENTRFYVLIFIECNVKRQKDFQKIENYQSQSVTFGIRISLIVDSR